MDVEFSQENTGYTHLIFYRTDLDLWFSMRTGKWVEDFNDATVINETTFDAVARAFNVVYTSTESKNKGKEFKNAAEACKLVLIVPVIYTKLNFTEFPDFDLAFKMDDVVVKL